MTDSETRKMSIPAKSAEQPADAEQRVRAFTFSTFSALGELLDLGEELDLLALLGLLLGEVRLLGH